MEIIVKNKTREKIRNIVACICGLGIIYIALIVICYIAFLFGILT